MKRLFIHLVLLLTTTVVLAQEVPLWLRYPAISPDGATILFTYKGDIYRVPTAGGPAVPITLHNARDYMPVWSHDGKQIAFASDRYGNYDVFIIPAEGGTAERLTYHSASDYPSDFSADNSKVLFTSSRQDAALNQQFPSGVLPELYQVPAKGGRVGQVLTTAAELARCSADGQTIVFHDRKGYEDAFRKHHTSSVTRDVWSYDVKTEAYTKLTDFEGEDRNPILAPDQQHIYYLSEANGDFNIHKMALDKPGKGTQISFFENHPIRSLSMSKAGLLCFSYNGELYTMREGQKAQKVVVSISADARYNEQRIVDVKSDIRDMALSPNGKEVAFVVRGEVFVASVKEGTTKRITSTPEQERNVSFSPDGRSILYAGERDGSWNVYQTSLTRDVEKYFFSSTVLKEEAVIATAAEEFQPAYSPDGKEVAYLEERTALKVLNLESKKVRQITTKESNYSYSDGDQYYEWSPDGKWFLLNFLQPNQWTDQAGLVSSDGTGEIINLSKSGYGAYSPQWKMDGQMMLYFSSRDGMKNHGSWGGEADVYAMFFTQEAYDKYKLNEEEFELRQEQEEEDEEEEDDEKKDEAKKDKKKEGELEPIKIELDGIEDRRVRLTLHSSRLSDAHVSKDGEHLYYLARFEKGYDLWHTNLRTRETKVLTKLGARSVGGIVENKKGTQLFILADGKIHKIKIPDGKRSSVAVNGEMILNEGKEMEYMFEHAWRQVDKKFYKIDLHEVDWDFYKKEYARFLPHINNKHDFAEMLSEMLGELNASHTGARYRPRNKEKGAETAALGLFFDNSHTDNGLKVEEVMDKGPFVNNDTKVKAGTIIEKIDGVAITPDLNHYQLLDRKRGKNTLISLFNPATGERWEETIQPISMGQENQLRYNRWVENCRKLTEELSDGKVGYVHVRGMNDRSYRTVYDQVLGEHANKEAIIVDTRFNGGGWLHDDLATFLNGTQYITFMPRGQNLGAEPQFKWKRESAVLMSESNYSDAHMFPYTYKQLGIGKLVGMPVPGTGTAVWWERLMDGEIVFGIPQVGMIDAAGNYLENNQLEPDIKVNNDPGIVSKGRDQQIEEAVKELLKDIKP
ncbi:MAG: S41 family peptidase [Bacteroidota bacterium]